METNIIKDLIGKTFHTVKNEDNEELLFLGDKSYKFFHYQDCCESVMIEDICGNLDDLINSPILTAEETSEASSHEDSESYYDGSTTWTFYNFSTAKGSVTVRWHGSSNGYYSESVDFMELP